MGGRMDRRTDTPSNRASSSPLKKGRFSIIFTTNQSNLCAGYEVRETVFRRVSGLNATFGLGPTIELYFGE